MSFLNSISAFFVRSEKAVENIVANIAKDIPVAIADIHGAANWLAKQTPAIAADIVTAVNLAELVGAPIAPATLLAVQAASASLTAFAAAHNAGQTTADSVVQGYVAYQQSAGLISQAKAASITAAAKSVISTAAKLAPAVATI